MRSDTLNMDQFFDKVRDKVGIKEVMDNLDSYTEDDIMNLPVDLWIKQQIIKYKKRGCENYDEHIQKLASMMQQGQPQPVEESFPVREWFGDDYLSKVSGMQIYAEPGDLFLIMDYEKNFVRWSRSAVTLDNKSFAKMLSESKLLGHMTLRKYLEFLSDRLNGKIPDQIIDLTNASPNSAGLRNPTLAKLGVRFS